MQVYGIFYEGSTCNVPKFFRSRRRRSRWFLILCSWGVPNHAGFQNFRRSWQRYRVLESYGESIWSHVANWYPKATIKRKFLSIYQRNVTCEFTVYLQIWMFKMPKLFARAYGARHGYCFCLDGTRQMKVTVSPLMRMRAWKFGWKYLLHLRNVKCRFTVYFTKFRRQNSPNFFAHASGARDAIW